MAQQRREPGLLDTWFASHPTSQERVQNARTMIRIVTALHVLRGHVALVVQDRDGLLVRALPDDVIAGMRAYVA